MSDFIEHLDKRDDEVLKAYGELERIFGQDFKRTRVSEIVDGEHIQVRPTNIRIDKEFDRDGEAELLDRRFEGLCTLKPYSYQRETILKILQLEKDGYHIDEETGKKIISNGWQISLPIGAGKSLCMEYLAIFHPEVPAHPIIVSGDARSLEDHEKIKFSDYPFYYEKCAYVEGEDSTVMVYKDYTPRPITLILTYDHLIPQMKSYFANDFPEVFKSDSVKIGFVERDQMNTYNVDPSMFDILVVQAGVGNVDALVRLSYERPFARVFVDDYTSMNDLARMRQILTPSFIPVSGQGNERDLSKVPSSYYSMKNIPIDAITLVGDPLKTYEGVYRSNIITGELMGSPSELDVYRFANSISSQYSNNNIFHGTPMEKMFSEMEEKRGIEEFMKYGFFIQNLSTIRAKSYQLFADYTHGKITRELIPAFTEWLDTTKDEKLKNILTTPPGELIDKSKIPLLVRSKCLVCRRIIEEHSGFGIVAGCCGCFVCSMCLTNASTDIIVDGNSGKSVRDNDNTYCCCCRAKNPRYYANSLRESFSSQCYSVNFISRYFTAGEKTKRLPPDYYFEMLMRGFSFKKEYANGKPINISTDIERGHIKLETLEKGEIPEVRKVSSIDLIGSQVIRGMAETFSALEIEPEPSSLIIMYRVKPEIREAFEADLAIIRQQRGKIKHPFMNCHMHFVDGLDEIIGLHANVLGIVAWDEDDDQFKRHQLLGRIMRCSTFKNKLNFYISLNPNAYA